METYNNLACLYWDVGDFENATRYFEEALKITKSQATDNRQQALLTGYRSVVIAYGEMLMTYKKYQKAKEVFEEYLKAILDDSEVKSLLQKCENIIGKARKLVSIVQHRDAESSSA